MRRILVSPDEKAKGRSGRGDHERGKTGESEHSRSRALLAPEDRREKHAREIGEIETWLFLGSNCLLALCVVCANAQVRAAASLLVVLGLTLRCVRKRAGGVRPIAYYARDTH